ncbi:hypothetical protein K502DRAFT_365207 [Neoconidiobolus thromboides FSU 785]|nr:hypothetical protein K502DRAFT_365207 [Neoconidiobolus thromboides FSU 785]
MIFQTKRNIESIIEAPLVVDIMNFEDNQSGYNIKRNKIIGEFNYSGNFEGKLSQKEDDIISLDIDFEQLSLDQGIEEDLSQVRMNNPSYLEVNGYLKQIHYENLSRRIIDRRGNRDFIEY